MTAAPIIFYKLPKDFEYRIHNQGKSIPFPFQAAPLQSDFSFSPPLELPYSQKLVRDFTQKVRENEPQFTLGDFIGYPSEIESIIATMLAAALPEYFVDNPASTSWYQHSMESECGSLGMPNNASKDPRMIFTRRKHGNYESALEVFVHSDEWLLLSYKKGKVSLPTIDRCSIKGYIYLHPQLKWAESEMGGENKVYAAVISSLLTGRKVGWPFEWESHLIKEGDTMNRLQCFPYLPIHNPTIKRIAAAVEEIKKIDYFCEKNAPQFKVAALLLNHAYLLSERYRKKMEEADVNRNTVWIEAKGLAPELGPLGNIDRERADSYLCNAVHQKIYVAEILLQSLKNSFPRGLLSNTRFSE